MQDHAELAAYPFPDPAAPSFHDEVMRVFAETGADPAMLRRIARYFKAARLG